MSTGAWVAVVAVALACCIGCFRMVTDGRFRVRRAVRRLPAGEAADHAASTDVSAGVQLAEALGEVQLGERATLLQFSSAFCAPCRVTRRVLAEVAAAVPGVTHLEVDAEHHLQLVRDLAILRTPTTIVLDSAGVEVTRAAGAPRKDQVLAALAGID